MLFMIIITLLWLLLAASFGFAEWGPILGFSLEFFSSMKDVDFVENQIIKVISFHLGFMWMLAAPAIYVNKKQQKKRNSISRSEHVA
ncbi:hypothetical protein D7Z54_24030 [Salibacterium salarium]|uniref:Uncharacterized protein n=1 Tax=Salibacterium salarium TaxID=284579 RepID=A0A3R9P4F0_9BACI|nr:hypothetical protein [Salibacterium salarium]RSL30863.1 hypothetical protein D7Z54_24030 [Salibacterium salarium]